MPDRVTYVSGGSYNSNDRSVTWSGFNVGQNETDTNSVIVTVNSPAIGGFIDFPCTLSGSGLNFTKSHKLRIKGRIRNIDKDVDTYTSIQQAINLAANDETIELEQGIYTESIYIADGKRLTITSTDPNNRAVVANTIIDGGPYAAAELANNDCVLTLAGLTLRSAGDVGIGNTQNVFGIGLNINSCSVYAPNGTVIYMPRRSDIIITASEIYGQSCVSAKDSNTLIDGCFLDGSFGIQTGYNISTYANKKDIIVRNCRIENCSSYGISVSYPKSFSAYGNIIHGSSNGPGISLYKPSAESNICNNLTYQNSTGINISNEYSGSIGTDILVRNNTVVDNVSKGIVLSGNTAKAPITNSIVWNNGTEITSGANVSYSCVKNGYSGNMNKSTDPGFIDQTNHNYHLKSDSNCINAGNPTTVLETGETDIDGEPREYGTNVDMGAMNTSPPTL